MASDDRKITKGSFLSDGRYFGFVFSTLIVWFIVVFIIVRFDIRLYLSSDTVKEMGNASIALATIPFAILSVLGALGRDKDEYYKVALAGIAVVFLICGLGCFMILWKYAVLPSTQMRYSVTMLWGFIGAFFIQVLWSFIARRSDLFKILFDISINATGTETFLSVFSFVLSFLVVQVSVHQVAGGSLLFFVWFGFTGGLISLIVLTFVGILSIPKSQNTSRVREWAFNILIVSILLCSFAALFPFLLSQPDAPVETPTTIHTATLMPTGVLTATATSVPTLSATSITTNTQEPVATPSSTSAPVQSRIVFLDDFSSNGKTRSQWYSQFGSWTASNGIYSCHKAGDACMSLITPWLITVNTAIDAGIRGDFGFEKGIYLTDLENKENILILFVSEPMNKIRVLQQSGSGPINEVSQDSPVPRNGIWFHVQVLLTPYHSMKISVNGDQRLDVPIDSPIDEYVVGLVIPMFSDNGSAASFDDFTITFLTESISTVTATP